MLIVNPNLVVFGTVTWEGVSSVAVDRKPHKSLVEWSDAGPHAVFADVPEQRVEITIVQELTREDLAAPRPAEQAALSVFTSPTYSDANRKRLTATCVVMSVEHDVSTRRGAMRTIRLVAVSTDGLADPLTLTEAVGGLDGGGHGGGGGGHDS